MESRPLSAWKQVLAGLVLVAALLAVVVVRRGSGSVRPRVALHQRSGHRVASMFMDDDHLIYSATPTVTRTLDTLKSLGVTEIRATVVWKLIAPDSASAVMPQGFSGSDPAAYSAARWAPYDRLVELAGARGITIDFNPTAPGPLWAVRPRAPSARYADHWVPSSAAFGRFVQALGTRYSGHYVPPGAHGPLPGVHFWSIWNEPNQPGWLAPQWRASPTGPVMQAPVLYRGYVDAGFAALDRTGHRPGSDTILVGELAPEGCVAGTHCIYPRPEWPIPPIPFLEGLYCVDSGFHPLSGAAASQLGCPRSPDPSRFASAHPALFQATGLAHHPYSFFLAPNAPMANPAFAPLANLVRLEHTLDSIFRSYGVSRRLPLYLTEYGYETNPPNPYRGVPPEVQSRYLNQAQYLAWRDPRVVTMNQFLLYDARPNRHYPPGSPGYWSTFQTGLLYANGARKPSFDSYRLPIFLPDPELKVGHHVHVWAMIRVAPSGAPQQAEIQWRPGSKSSYRTLAHARTEAASEVIQTTVTVPGPGAIRVRWASPTGQVQYSRAATVRAR
ncbi:MAG: hypothetical protein ACJ764_05735 [Solirubrobacteraceae bacterium]